MMTSPELIQRALWSANILRDHALHEIHGVDIIPNAVGVILILGDAVLPGYISRIIVEPQRLDQSELLQKLRQEDPFLDTGLTDWISLEGDTYPSVTAYILALDEVRRLAIDFLMQNQGQSSTSPDSN